MLASFVTRIFAVRRKKVLIKTKDVLDILGIYVRVTVNNTYIVHIYCIKLCFGTYCLDSTC